MKRKIVVALLALAFLTTVAHAQVGFALGAEATLDILGSGVFPGAALTVSPPLLPIMFGAGFIIGDPLIVGFTLDWWLLHTPLVGVLRVYFGPGLFLAISHAVDLGIRLPVGLQLYIVPPFEIFFEIAPHIGISFTQPKPFSTIGLVGALGFRFWF